MSSNDDCDMGSHIAPTDCRIEELDFGHLEDACFAPRRKRIFGKTKDPRAAKVAKQELDSIDLQCLLDSALATEKDAPLPADYKQGFKKDKADLKGEVEADTDTKTDSKTDAKADLVVETDWAQDTIRANLDAWIKPYLLDTIDRGVAKHRCHSTAYHKMKSLAKKMGKTHDSASRDAQQVAKAAVARWRALRFGE